MSDSLDRLVRESRPDLGTREARNVDWAEVDRGLFGRIEDEQRAERARLTSGRSARWAVAAGGLAVAAAIALVVGTSRQTRSIDGAQVVAEEGAGTVTAVEGGGQLLVDGKSVGVGAALRMGDVIEARGAQATIERLGKLTLIFERGSKATVTHVDGALVLALEAGAVEAQVVPVASGEAFAVDVGHSRVAVHGTHLRVARVGEHVMVDLSEGVISLGEAPRIGSTLGSLLTAPAHAEFTTSDAEGTLTLSHDPAVLRAPVSLGASTPVRAGLPSVALALPAGTYLARLVKGGMLEVLGEDFVRTARAKGASETRVLFNHALRNAILPVVTVLGLQFGALLTGAAVIEIVFSRPGLGSYAVTAIQNRDFPQIQGTVMVVAALFVAINLLVDLLYPLIDPRSAGGGSDNP